MPEDYSYNSRTSGSPEQEPPTTSTSGSLSTAKVGFEDLWQSGWQSITSGGAQLLSDATSITGTGIKTDIQNNLPKLKRVRRKIRHFFLRKNDYI
jgi:hypothetical protein